MNFKCQSFLACSLITWFCVQSLWNHWFRRHFISKQLDKIYDYAQRYLLCSQNIEHGPPNSDSRSHFLWLWKWKIRYVRSPYCHSHYQGKAFTSRSDSRQKICYTCLHKFRTLYIEILYTIRSAIRYSQGHYIIGQLKALAFTNWCQRQGYQANSRIRINADQENLRIQQYWLQQCCQYGDMILCDIPLPFWTWGGVFPLFPSLFEC